MNYLDYIIFIIVIAAFILGFKDGLIRKLIGLAGIIIGIILAVKFAYKVGTFIAPMFDNEQYFANVIAGFLIFIAVILITTILKRIIHPHDKINKMVNQVLGGITGIIQIMFILSGVFFLLAIFKVPEESDRNKSLLYSSISSILPKSVDLVIGKDGYVKSYMQKNENKIDKKVVSQEENNGVKKAILKPDSKSEIKKSPVNNKNHKGKKNNNK